MSFHMPKVCIKDVEFDAAMMLPDLVDINWRLVTCPDHRVSDITKIFHNTILRELYRDLRWTVPVWYAWQMPHTVLPYEKLRNQFIPLVKQMLDVNAFKDPQPVCIGHKTYQVFREDGSFYEFIIP